MVGSQTHEFEFSGGVGENSLDGTLLAIVQLHDGAQLRDALGVLDSADNDAAEFEGRGGEALTRQAENPSAREVSVFWFFAFAIKRPRFG
jgi:hypothetical protein